MANALYPKFKEALLGADVDLLVDNIKVVIVDLADYTYSAAHDFLDDVAVGGRVATSGNLANKTTTSGVFDADDITITGVTGDTVEALILYKDSGSAATSNLIAYWDTGVTGLTLTPNGGDVTITWPSGADKIFAL